MQTWRFLYTIKSTWKKAITKTGYPLPNVTKYVTTDGKDYAACLSKARTECGFKESQLLGGRQIS